MHNAIRSVAALVIGFCGRDATAQTANVLFEEVPASACKADEKIDWAPEEFCTRDYAVHVVGAGSYNNARLQILLYDVHSAHCVNKANVEVPSNDWRRLVAFASEERIYVIHFRVDKTTKAFVLGGRYYDLPGLVPGPFKEIAHLDTANVARMSGRTSWELLTLADYPELVFQYDQEQARITGHLYQTHPRNVDDKKKKLFVAWVFDRDLNLLFTGSQLIGPVDAGISVRNTRTGEDGRVHYVMSYYTDASFASAISGNMKGGLVLVTLGAKGGRSTPIQLPNGAVAQSAQLLLIDDRPVVAGFYGRGGGAVGYFIYRDPGSGTGDTEAELHPFEHAISEGAYVMDLHTLPDGSCILFGASQSDAIMSSKGTSMVAVSLDPHLNLRWQRVLPRVVQLMGTGSIFQASFLVGDELRVVYFDSDENFEAVKAGRKPVYHSGQKAGYIVAGIDAMGGMSYTKMPTDKYRMENMRSLGVPLGNGQFWSRTKEYTGVKPTDLVLITFN